MKTLQKNGIEVIEQSGKYILTEEQMKKLGFEDTQEDIVPDRRNECKPKGFYVTSTSDICAHSKEVRGKIDRNIRPTKELAKACLALSQLCQLRNETWKRYNKSIGKDGMWEPDYNSTEDKFTIVNFTGDIATSIGTHISHVLSFPTKEIRDQFLEKHRELIEIAKPLL